MAISRVFLPNELFFSGHLECHPFLTVQTNYKVSIEHGFGVRRALPTDEVPTLPPVPLAALIAHSGFLNWSRGSLSLTLLLSARTLRCPRAHGITAAKSCPRNSLMKPFVLTLATFALAGFVYNLLDIRSRAPLLARAAGPIRHGDRCSVNYGSTARDTAARSPWPPSDERPLRSRDTETAIDHVHSIELIGPPLQRTAGLTSRHVTSRHVTSRHVTQDSLHCFTNASHPFAEVSPMPLHALQANALRRAETTSECLCTLRRAKPEYSPGYFGLNFMAATGIAVRRCARSIVISNRRRGRSSQAARRPGSINDRSDHRDTLCTHLDG